jgi:hypothetical protein
MELVLEVKEEDATSGHIAPGVMMTPAIGEDFWFYRVRLGDNGQAVLGFPKYTTIGIGFAIEEDWNTNLPYRCSTQEIFEHIRHNKGDASIDDVDVVTAIKMIQEAAHKLRRTDPAEMTKGLGGA